MANEIQLIHDDGAETVYAIVRDMLGNWYHGTNPEAFDDANWGDYDIALAEVHAAASGNVAVQATFPAVAAGFYWLDVYVQAGANPAQTDYRVCSCLMYWNATTLVPAGGAADVRQINASEEAAANVADALDYDLMVSGTLSPDVTGRYSRVADVNGYSAWARDTGGWYINWSVALDTYCITQASDGDTAYEDTHWETASDPYEPVQLYDNYGDATGKATAEERDFVNMAQIGSAAALAAYNIDSTGGTLSLAKAVEALVAWSSGKCVYDAATGVATYYGKDGTTVIVTTPLTGGGNRSKQTIS